MVGMIHFRTAEASVAQGFGRRVRWVMASQVSDQAFTVVREDTLACSPSAEIWR